MGGRGASSGMSAKSSGFSYKNNGKYFVVQKTSAGVVLINGAPNKSISYEKLKEFAKSTDTYVSLTASDLEELRKKKYKNYNSHDYELLGNTRGKKKSIYRPRRGR